MTLQEEGEQERAVRVEHKPSTSHPTCMKPVECKSDLFRNSVTWVLTFATWILPLSFPQEFPWLWRALFHFCLNSVYIYFFLQRSGSNPSWFQRILTAKLVRKQKPKCCRWSSGHSASVQFSGAYPSFRSTLLLVEAIMSWFFNLLFQLRRLSKACLISCFLWEAFLIGTFHHIPRVIIPPSQDERFLHGAYTLSPAFQYSLPSLPPQGICSYGGFLTFTAQKPQLIAWQTPPDILLFSVPGEGQLMVQEMMWSPVYL